MMQPDYIIFPDASEKRSGKKKYSGYGVVILDIRNNKYFTVNGEMNNRTLPYCEGWAIYSGLQYVERVRKPEERLKVLIVSDSQTNVNALTVWLHKSWNLSDYNNWLKRDGTPVRNQKLYRKILALILDGHYKVKIVHFRSHSKNNPKMRKLIKSELKANKIKINDETLDVFIQMNQLADDLACEASARRRDTDGEFYRLMLKGDFYE